jgi:glucose/arabinose dehydrogenase
MPHSPTNGAELAKWNAEHPLGAAWGNETDRADVLEFTPEGKNGRVFATGIRNCVGLAVGHNGDLWCSTNERDSLGDDVPSDYITRVREGAFYGWPWYYIGANEDPRHRGARPDLKDKIAVPDVLLQAHSASLGITFYTGQQFPPEYSGDIFAAEHGSWNRGKRTGYKVIRVIIKGRPVGVAVAKDGALLVSEDANGTIWRIASATMIWRFMVG